MLNDTKITYLLTKKNKEISFYEEGHKYYFKGRVFSSVTTRISQYANRFDEDGAIAKAIARREGKTPEAVIEGWNEKKKTSAEFGTRIHFYAECLVRGWDNFVINHDPSDKLHLKSVVEFLATKDKSNLIPEVIVYDENIGLAGQIDLIEVHTDGVIIYDYKTNRNPIYHMDPSSDVMLPVVFNPYGKYLKNPLGNVPDTDFFKYSLQLSTYRLFLERWGIPVKGCYLVHVRPDCFNVIETTDLTKESAYL